MSSYLYNSKTHKVTDTKGKPVLIKEPSECKNMGEVVGEIQKIMNLPDQMFVDIFKEIRQDENIENAMRWFD